MASCEALDVMLQESDRVEAGEMLTEALQMFLDACYEGGNLDAELCDRGFQAAAGLLDRRIIARMLNTGEMR